MHETLHMQGELQANILTVPEVANLLGVDQSTIHRRIGRGAITPSLLVGNRPLFTADDVERLKRGEQQLPDEKVAS